MERYFAVETLPQAISSCFEWHPPPTDGTLTQRRTWAFRAYHGIGRGGRRFDGLTQGEIADVIGVTRQTVNRWLNEDDIAEDVFGGLSERDRWLIFGMAITGGRVEEYLDLLRLEQRAENSEINPHADPNDDGNGNGPQIYPDID